MTPWLILKNYTGIPLRNWHYKKGPEISEPFFFYYTHTYFFSVTEFTMFFTASSIVNLV